MRITNSMMIDNFLGNMGRSMGRVNKYNQQAMTGKKLARISDDPIKMVSAMNARQMMYSYQQYEENLKAANSWVDQTETALRDVHSALSAIKEQIVLANNDTNETIDRNAIAKIVEQHRDHIIQSLNTTISGKHLFAGFNTTNKPFAVGPNGKVTYNGIDLAAVAATDPGIIAELEQKIKLEVGLDVKMDVTFTGVEIAGVGDNNMFKVLDDLIADLKTGNGGNNLGKYITKLEKQEQNVMEKVVTIGARSTKLEILGNRYSQDIINYDAVRGRIEDADEAEAIMKMKMADFVYKQALAIGAKIIVPTLMDYLR